ncbi:unnamed protein product [Ectocarpus sp. CCAP 1310/34]|nr:unnamed protein product [Ectocarpus sp. CCAP 1310/34]
MVFRDPSFGVQQMQATMRNIFLDERMRRRTKGQIAGRGFAMATKTSGPICFECNEPGHARRNCPNRQRKGHMAKKAKPAGATKWCSVHNTTTHSDEECYSQGAELPERTGKDFSACTHCMHRSTQSEDTHAKPTTTETHNETEKTEKADIDFSTTKTHSRVDSCTMLHAATEANALSRQLQLGLQHWWILELLRPCSTTASSRMDVSKKNARRPRSSTLLEKARFKALSLGSYTAPSNSTKNSNYPSSYKVSSCQD